MLETRYIAKKDEFFRRGKEKGSKQENVATKKCTPKRKHQVQHKKLPGNIGRSLRWIMVYVTFFSHGTTFWHNINYWVADAPTMNSM